MVERIAMLLRAKNLTPSQLADEIGVQRSGISHILNGRNKPSLDFIQRVIKRYPDVSIKWIMFGEGAMMNPYPASADPKQNQQSSAKPLMIELFPPDVDSEPENQIVEEEKVNESVPDKSDNVRVITNINTIDDASQKINKHEESQNASQVEVNAQSQPQQKASVAVESNVRIDPGSKKEIKRIIIFYTDRSFVEYSPSNE
ncbi:MAG: helix-turn-helix transcriptional regulator [Lentimicrobiaceae bacterium]